MSAVQRCCIAASAVVALGLGCAAPGPGSMHDDDFGVAEDRKQAKEGVGHGEELLEPAVEGEASPERSLGELERELAENEARLRALGVELPVVALAQDEPAETTATPGPREKDTRSREAKPRRGGGKKPQAQPGSRPSAPPSGGGAGGGAKSSGDLVDDIGSGNADEDRADKKKGDGRFAQPPPDPAKAAPRPDDVAPPLDAAGRCVQICELSEITCELSVQVCELAARHDDEDDYRIACERAVDDCEVAQEACDECAQ